MSITIQPAGSIKRFIAPDSVLENADTVGEAMEKIDLPDNIGVVMMVNGRIAHWNTPLTDGDILQLIPTIAGG